MCLHSSNGCPQTRPVRCPTDSPLINEAPLPIHDNCQNICESTEGCMSIGSYCKTWQDEPVCFGLYYKDSGKTRTCFFPNDSSCPQSLPVSCAATLTTAVSTTTEPVSSPEAVAQSTVREMSTQRAAVITTRASTSIPLSTGPLGRYKGSFSFGEHKVEVTVEFMDRHTLTMTINAPSLNWTLSEAGLGYVMEGNRIRLIVDDKSTKFFGKLMKCDPKNVDIVFDAAADQIRATLVIGTASIPIIGRKIA
jgi:hypothetical protein